MYAWMFMYICRDIYICIYLYAYIFVSIYIYMYTYVYSYDPKTIAYSYPYISKYSLRHQEIYVYVAAC